METANINKTTKTDIYNIDPRAIVVVDGFNSRIDFGDIDELAQQIETQGMLNPISVVPFKDEDGNDKYRLVDGERRYRAVMSLIEKGKDIARIKALFLSKSLTDADLYVQQVMRNEGKPFNEFEMGVHCRKLKEICGKTNTEIAEMLGKNVGQISYYLQVLEMDPKVQDAIKTNRISGSNMRRIYQACKGDESLVVKKVLALIKAADDKGATKLKLSDLGNDDEVVIAKDSKKIRDGLIELFAYYDAYSNNGRDAFDLDFRNIAVRLKAGEFITDILKDMKMVYKKAE